MGSLNEMILDSYGISFIFSSHRLWAACCVTLTACVRVFQEKESIAKCITDLKALAKSTKAQATA